MFSKLKSQRVMGCEEIGAFFDRLAPAYSEQHGSPERLLRNRLKIIRRYAPSGKDSVILELGCGPGQHLKSLIGENRQGIGIDISSGMIDQANRRLRGSHFQDRIIFRQGNAEKCLPVSRETVDFAFCVGAFEHMIDKKAVLRQVLRVLKPKGCFLCLTRNGGSFWNRRIASSLRMNMNHLSTDDFLSPEEISLLVRACGYASSELGYWSFVPRGDVYFPFGVFIQIMNFLGRIFKQGPLQEGLLFAAWKD